MKEQRERAFTYATFYNSTKTKSEYMSMVVSVVGGGNAEEASVAWEAIDQYEGEVNPR